MPTFEFPKVDLSKFDLSKVDWSKFDLSKVELPSFELPDLGAFDPSKIDWSKFDLRNIDLPELPDVDLPSAEQVLGFARDAAYVGVGLAVMTAERLQKLQDELVDLLKAQLERVRAAA